MSSRMRTRSAGRPVAESRGGRTGERVGIGGREVNGILKGVNGGVGGAPNFSTIIAQQLQNLFPAMLAQDGNQENVRNQNGNVVNENIRNVLVNGNRVGCSYKEFLAYNPKEYDGKGGVVVLTRWIEKMQFVQDMSGCSIDQKMKYIAGSFVGKALTCHEIQKLETELWNHTMVEVGHAAYTDKFHELARLVPHLVTLESRNIERNELIKKVKKRGNVGEPSKDKKGMDNNKRTRTGIFFAFIANPVGRENTGAWHKCTTYNSYHAPGGPCRTCFNCNRPGHLEKDCKGIHRNVNLVNARNPTVRACYECGSNDHVRNQENQARGRAFMLRAEEARQDLNIMTGTKPSKLGFRYEIKIASGHKSFDVILVMDWLSNHKVKIICHEKVVRPLLDCKVLRVLGEKLEEKMRQLKSAKAKEKEQEKIVVVRDFPKVFLDDLCGLPPGYALLRKKFKEDLFIYCIENLILQDSFEPSYDNTNVVNALQEPFVVKQDLGKNSSQSPPQINHHCSYGCGDSLEDIFCHQCTCELCRKGAHYGYNCPLKVPNIPDTEPFNNQTIDELPKTVPSFDPICYSEDGNSFTYDSISNLVHDSPNVFNPPPQPLTYSYEFCGNDAYYGYDYPLQFPIIHQPIHEKTCPELLAKEQEANTQPFQYPVIPQPPQKEISVEFLQEKRNQVDYVKTFLRKFNRISFYEMPKVLSLACETIQEINLAFEDKHCQSEDILELFQRLHNDVQNIQEELAVYINTPSWDRPTVYDDDDDDEDYTIAIITILSTEEPDNSLSMGDEHLDTISATESDEFIKSSVENLVPIPRGINDDILLTIKDGILREKLLNINLLIANIEALKDNPTLSSDFLTKSSSTSLNFLLEETNTFDNSLPESETLCFNLEEISSGSTTTHFDISLPDYEVFYDDHVNEISSGSTTAHSDYSLYDSFIFDLSINPFPPADRSDFYEFTDELAHIISSIEYDCFCFKNEPNSGGFHYRCGG
uniref:CCHC-type domain-containing protein n=1 Tax=Tanacetum cinerariifolium TaxID=118510 RepID=A0A6L2M2F9_TANCI|nr:hypothetical protein [Tanacetum cinerariifolium]